MKYYEPKRRVCQSGRKGGIVKQFIAVSALALILCLQSPADVTNQVVTPLTYTGRSTEAAGSIVSSSSIGGEVTAALALPLDLNQTIFDNGAYHTTDFPPSNGVAWASWGYYGAAQYQARHFEAYFVLPTGLQTVVGFTLSSPYYTALGDLVPVDDNAYFYLNGTFIGEKGTSYGAINTTPAHETNGWAQDGSFGSGPVALLHPGTNIVDIVDEDYGSGGGTGPLNVKLSVVPEPSTLVLTFSAFPILFYLRKKRVG